MHEDELKKHHERAIWFRRKVGGQVSLSKLGGLPTLPTEIQWPRQSQTGTPLHFLAQIDLSQLPATPLDGAPRDVTLPARGILYFFADMVEEMLWFEEPFATTRVIYANQAGPERSPPSDTPDILHAYGKRSGGYDTGIVKYPHATLQPHLIETFGLLDPIPEPNSYTAAALARIASSIENAIGPLPVYADYPMHQMFGAARSVQYTEENAQEGTVLLLQIDSDKGIHKDFMFCDMGAAQFWIKVADLKAMRFDKAWGSTGGG